MEMKSKQTEINVLGQRSIASSFLSRSSSPYKNDKEGVKEQSTRKVSCVSLSDFLHQKLNKNSVLHKTVQDKSNPFRTPACSGDGKIEINKEGEEERNTVLDKLVFEQFKHTCAGKRDAPVELDEDGVTESRKRRHPFADSDDKRPTQRPFVILGDDSKYKQKGKRESLISKKKPSPRPHYNHYANGSGWWDCGMEGVDEEEVGYGEVWEGVGSTTFGGIEWH